MSRVTNVNKLLKLKCIASVKGLTTRQPKAYWKTK